MSHRTAGVRVLERAAIGASELPKLLHDLMACEHVSEAAVLSTCNRVEVYAVVDAFHGALGEVNSVLSRTTGVDTEVLVENLYVYYAGAAVQHLFSVAGGLDSMVVGEPQILGQVRNAYSTAREAGTVGTALHEVIQYALRVGKRVHAETGIDSAGASVVSEVLTDAEQLIGGLDGRTALLVGAGAMGGLAAAHLRRAGVTDIVIANRTVDNGVRLAENLGTEGVSARATGLDALAEEMARVDLVVACTGATDTVLDAEVVAAAMRERDSLVLCDLGLPRDVDPAVVRLPGVSVIDLEALQRRLPANPADDHAGAARQLVADEVAEYLTAQRSAAVTPTVTALRKRAAEVVDTELLRLDSRLPQLDDGVRDELNRTVRRVVDKLLHTPTVRVKELASAPNGTEYADALRELFNLDPNAPVAVAESDAEGGTQ
jgi:glutamyl-tRNA reductase